jgi:CHASE2 domain
MSADPRFQLDIQRVQDTCLFKLSWGNGLQLKATVSYPEILTRLYQDWRRAYLSFYSVSMRGKAELSGTLALTEVDWRIKLARAEAALLAEFYQWLRSAELYEIRETIVQSTKYLVPLKGISETSKWADVYLSCDPSELESLPWETWEIGAAIRIVRSPVNIRHEPIHPRKGRPRILVILGDDTGLNFEAELAAVKKQLKPLADVQYIGWQITSTVVNALKTQILEALVAEQGWDALLFFGHSDEASLTGGELAIAPNTWITIGEITPQLIKAKEQGLQFALFNSCNGLNIAGALINLGLSQVVVMREPIENTVAQKFLVQFLQVLATHRDVHDAMIAVTQDLKLNHTTTFPSAYLIPSIFRHRDAALFRIKPRGLWQFLQPLVPTRREGIALAALLALLLVDFKAPDLMPKLFKSPPLQTLLLDSRMAAQALFRYVTHQDPPKIVTPVQLVLIDQQSLKNAKPAIPAKKYTPLDRSYLARILKKLSVLPTKVIGIDYLLEKQTDDADDRALVAATRQLISQGTWLVFGNSKNEHGSERLEPIKQLSSNWTLQADIDAPARFIDIPPELSSCNKNLYPFAYLLGLMHTLETESGMSRLKPQLQDKTDLQNRVCTKIQETSNAAQNRSISGVKVSENSVASFSRLFKSTWLEPLIDFSIKPSLVYESIPAWQLLDESVRQTDFSSQRNERIYIVAAGNYEKPPEDEDEYALPLAVEVWRVLENKENSATVITGGEMHSYRVHHILSQHLVIPIPDLWLIGIAVIVGQGIRIIIRRHPVWRTQIIYVLVGGTIVYGLVGLQVYVGAKVLLPWLLPSMVVWGYGYPVLRHIKGEVGR